MLLYAAYAGSTLYNLQLANSDQDIRGIFIEPANVFFSLNPVDFYEDTVSDTILYGLRKFANIALKSNPNALELLFAPVDKWITSSAHWFPIYNERRQFISTKAIQSYKGFILQEYDLFIANKSNRSDLLDRYGYDTKRAANIVRLLINLQELKTEGIINPALQLHERALVYKIKRGDYTRIQAVQLLDHILPILKMESIDLPEEPNYQRINDVVAQLYTKHYAKC